MQRIERVFNFIQALPPDTKVTAQDIANSLAITRANASSDLNQLTKENRLIKSGRKPVFFAIAKNEKQTLLEEFSVKNPSLKSAIEQSKAAVLYPPQRMHILLTGETGTGKSMFAELIYNFSVEQTRVDKNAKFVTFNCADYANNPQLILGQIFGVVKGAYTGAEAERSGLVEEADGGILFLDEVHRLTPEAQEMLFTFIDKKIFHRLGETSFDRTADVQLICATTECIDSSLLQTFTRRIPMKIHLPSLQDRGLPERLNLLNTFFNEEAHNLKHDIRVSMNSLRGLLSYPCPNNIGQLKTDVQLLCAQSYARSITNRETSLTITSYDLPPEIKEGLYVNEKRNDIWKLIPSQNKRFLTFHQDQKTNFSFEEDNTYDIYQLIDHKVEDMEKIGLNPKAMMEIVEMTIQDFFHTIKSKKYDNYEHIINLVGSEIVTAAKHFLIASMNPTDSVSESVVSGLALHLYNLVQRLENSQKILNPKLKEIKEIHRGYYEIALKNKGIIEDALTISLPEEEIGFLTLFLTPSIKNEESEKVKVIVVAHGESTATSMADAANELLESQSVTGFNMPLSCKPKSMLSEIEVYLKQIQRKNILILTDMGSLTNFAEELSKKTGCQVMCVDLVSTLHVLEAGRKAQLGYDLQELVNEIKKITHIDEVNWNKTIEVKKTFIVTACTTGRGSARMILNLLKNQLELYEGQIEIRACQITDQEELEKELNLLRQEGNILCCISTFDIKNVHCPFFNLAQVFEIQTLQRIQQLIDFEVASNLAIQNVSPMIQSIEGEILLGNIKSWLASAEHELGLSILPEIKIGLMCHLASVIDALRSNKVFLEEIILRKNREEEKLYQTLHSLELVYGISFSQVNFEHILSYVFSNRNTDDKIKKQSISHLS